MKIFKTIFLGALLSLLAFSQAQADRLDDIQKRGTLNVAVSLFSPWTIKTKDGTLIGFEIDVARKVARSLGVEANFVVYTWEDVLPAIAEGEIDLVAAGTVITAERALKTSFSNPYSEDGVSLVTNTAMTSTFSSIADFNRPSVKIGMVRGTTYAQVAKKKFDRATIREFLETKDATQAVLDGTVHAYAASVVQTRFLAMDNADILDVPLEPLRRSRAAFAVPRGEFALVNFLNAWIIENEADDWLSERRAYWFQSLNWLE